MQKEAFAEVPQEVWPSAKQQELLAQITEAQKHLSLDVKSLYVWTALIRDIFRNSDAKIDLRELERISLARHKFIIHVHSGNREFLRTSLDPRGGIRLSAAHEEVEILFNVRFSRAKWIGFKSVIRQATPFIPELAKEKNQTEQLNILYRQVNDITDQTVRRLAFDKIFRIGMATDQPGVIAMALLDALVEYRRS